MPSGAQRLLGEIKKQKKTQIIYNTMSGGDKCVKIKQTRKQRVMGCITLYLLVREGLHTEAIFEQRPRLGKRKSARRLQRKKACQEYGISGTSLLGANSVACQTPVMSVS